jgi:iron complex outermembrane receptor protein
MLKYLTLSIGLTLCTATLATAQTKLDTTKSYPIKQVIVTTTRTTEPLEHVPMAVSIVPASEFAIGRHYELKDALWSVPGVLTQSRSGHTDLRITIRGYGARGAANRSNAGNMRGIRVLVDGIPETEPDGRTSLDLINLDATSRVEVLRSNSSTLYGSASGGVINLYTRFDFDAPFIESRNSAGSFNFLRNAVNAGTTFGESKLFVSAVNTTFGDGEHNAYRKHSGASQLLFSLGLKAPLDERTDFGLYASASSNLFRFPGPLTRAQFTADPSQANAAFVARDERRFNRQGKIAMTLDHEFNAEHTVSGSVYLQPKVLERSERATYRDFNRYGIGSQARYEWNTSFSPTLENTFSIGFDQQYQDGTILFYTITPNGGRGDTLQQNKKEASSTIGGYAEESLTLAEDLTLKLGARYDMITYRALNFMKMGPTQKKEFTQLTPKAGIAYEFMKGYSVYGSVGGGVEAPAFNEIDPPSDSIIIARGGTPSEENPDFNPLLEPIISTSFEVGSRGLIPMKGTLAYITYDVAAYLINIENDLVPWNGGRYYFTAAETRRTGLELGLSAGTTFGLSAKSAVTISRSTYLKYENLLGRFDNNQTAGLPGIFGSLHLRYDAPADLFIEGSVDHVGEYFADDRNDLKSDGTPDPSVDSKVPAYTIFGATAGWKNEFGPIALDIFASIHNIADLSYISSAFINGEQNQYFEPGLPRNFILGATVRFR